VPGRADHVVYRRRCIVCALQGFSPGPTPRGRKFTCALSSPIQFDSWGALGFRRKFDQTRDPEEPMLDPERGAYLDRLTAAAASDPTVAAAYLRVTQLIDPPAALFSREIAERILP
jgi:hypothetical protein